MRKNYVISDNCVLMVERSACKTWALGGHYTNGTICFCFERLNLAYILPWISPWLKIKWIPPLKSGYDLYELKWLVWQSSLSKSNNTDRTDRAKRDPYNGRVTAKHQYTCTQVDYFLPRDAAEKIWSFWNRHQSPKSPFPSKCLVPGFLAH